MISVAIASFNRPRPLYWGLKSISEQKPNLDFEVVVLNDGLDTDGTKEVCKQFGSALPLKYVFAGQRHAASIVTRNPAIPNNMAVHECSGEYLILSCAEMYHLQDTITAFAKVLCKDDVVTTPSRIMLDHEGEFLNQLESGNLTPCTELKTGPCATQPHDPTVWNFFPFFMGMRRSRFDAMGGYDEDFDGGYGLDDVDLSWRIIDSGTKMVAVQSSVIHLYHGPRCTDFDHTKLPGYQRNLMLMNQRRGQVTRNKSRRRTE